MTVLMEKMMTNDWIYGHTMFRKKKHIKWWDFLLPVHQ